MTTDRSNAEPAVVRLIRDPHERLGSPGRQTWVRSGLTAVTWRFSSEL